MLYTHIPNAVFLVPRKSKPFGQELALGRHDLSPHINKAGNPSPHPSVIISSSTLLLIRHLPDAYLVVKYLNSLGLFFFVALASTAVDLAFDSQACLSPIGLLCNGCKLSFLADVSTVSALTSSLTEARACAELLALLSSGALLSEKKNGERGRSVIVNVRNPSRRLRLGSAPCSSKSSGKNASGALWKLTRGGRLGLAVSGLGAGLALTNFSGGGLGLCMFA